MVDSQTFDRHKRHEASKRVQDAFAATTAACKSQDDAIAAHLASLSLSSKHPTNLLAPLRGSPSSFSGKSTEQKRVEESLYQLRDIETSLDNLITSVDGKLGQIGYPGAANDAFPLLSSISTSRMIQAKLSGITSRAASVREAKSSLQVRLGELVTRLEAEKHSWSKHAKALPTPPDFSDTIFSTGMQWFWNSNSLQSDFVPLEQHNTPILQDVDPIIHVAVFTMVVLQVILHNSRRGCHFVLSMLQYIVQLSLLRNGRVLNVHNQKLLADFPKDPDTAIKQFKLETKEAIYAVCPKQKCQSLYPPAYQKDSPIPRYPMFCTHKSFDGDSECGTHITRPRRFGNADAEVPIKRFVAFSFKDYIAELTSRSGFEDKMNAAWKGDRDSNGSSTDMRDVFDGKFLRDFEHRDGRQFGLQTKEGRYVFSLSADFFNPFTNKQAGKSVSFGAISVVCLNLPVSMRYKPENMFLAGVIPGPKEPHLTLHQYLSPIVDEFLEFWDPGVQLSHTCNFPEGRLILCALILVVCDLLATWKTIGYAACTHDRFCNMCDCTRSGQGYGHTDCETWSWRTNEEWCTAATEYQACKSEDEKVTKFNKTGVRWSELLRLPYFDVTRCVVIDPMHNLFLGLIKEHFNGILGINLSKPKGEKRAIIVNLGTRPLTLNPNDVKGVEKLRRWLEKPVASTFPDRHLALKKLQCVNLPALEFVCSELHCNVPPLPLPTKPQRNRHTKGELAEALLEWRLHQSEMQFGSSTSTESGQVLQPKEIE
jgi:hypothetical protein